jgi:hypothetical protein
MEQPTSEQVTAEQRADEAVQSCIHEDGALYDLGWYLAWEPKSDTATLDGYFTAAELHAIANYMEKHGE